jgi:dTDP-4-dehydrorhamnose 3,5-epimerase
MIIKKWKFDGVYEILLELKHDDRGYFMRTYDYDIFNEQGIHRNWVQESQSYNRHKGTVRGFHFQFPPNIETKLVRVIRGKIFDIILDLRLNSPTFGKWESIILSEENKKMLLIPRGFAHGMCTLEDHSIMLYKMDNKYEPSNEGTIKWDDPDLGVEWPCETPIISNRDSMAGSYKDFIRLNEGLNIH